MADFTPILNAILSGADKGWDASIAQKQLNAKTALEQSKATRESAKNDADMMDKGLKFNPTSNKYEPDPDFYTPPGSVTPGQTNAFAQAQTAAGMAGAMNPDAPNPATALGATQASSGIRAAPQGNPSYLRVQRLAELKAAQNPKYMADPPTIRTAYALANNGAPLPPELESIGEKPYHQDLNPLLTRNINPDRAPAPDEATRALELSEGMPEGTLKGISKGKVAGVKGFMIGQGVKVDLAKQREEAAGTRQDRALGVHESIANNELDLKKAQALEHSPENQAFSKKYVDYVGGVRDAQVGVLRDLAEARDQLRARAKNGDSTWQSYAPGLVPTFDKDLQAIKDNVQNAASSDGLSKRFGGKVSNLEFQNAVRFSIDPHLTDAQNADLIDKRIRTGMEKMSAQDKWASYYQKNKGNMKAYQGIGGDDFSSGPDAPTAPQSEEAPLNPSAVRAEQAKKWRVAVNGTGIPKKTVDQLQSFPTKGTASNPQDGAVMTSSKDGKYYKRQGGQWFPVKPGEATE